MIPCFLTQAGATASALLRGAKPDRVEESRSGGTPEPLRRLLFALLGSEKVLHKISG
jgi:hypothetical protein